MKNKLPVRVIMALFLLVMSIVNLAARPTEEGHRDNHHHLNEIGISTGVVRMQPESETAPGLHLHAMRRLGDEGIKKFFGIGLGLEIIFSEHRHYSIMGTLEIFPWKKLVITFSPGILTVKEDGENQRRFSFHCEVMYEFEVGAFEMGPALGFAVAGEDTHFTVGIHIGKGF